MSTSLVQVPWSEFFAFQGITWPISPEWKTYFQNVWESINTLPERLCRPDGVWRSRNYLVAFMPYVSCVDTRLDMRCNMSLYLEPARRYPDRQEDKTDSEVPERRLPNRGQHPKREPLEFQLVIAIGATPTTEVLISLLRLLVNYSTSSTCRQRDREYYVYSVVIVNFGKNIAEAQPILLSSMPLEEQEKGVEYLAELRAKIHDRYAHVDAYAQEIMHDLYGKIQEFEGHLAKAATLERDSTLSMLEPVTFRANYALRFPRISTTRGICYSNGICPISIEQLLAYLQQQVRDVCVHASLAPLSSI